MAHPFPSTTDTDAASRTSEALGEQAHHGIDRVSGGAHQAVDRVASVATTATNRMGELATAPKTNGLTPRAATSESIPWRPSASRSPSAICSVD